MNNYRKYYSKFHLAIILISIVAMSSCKKFVEVDLPINEYAGDRLFESDATTISALAGIYSEMSSAGFASGSTSSISHLAGRSSDEFKNYTSSTTPISTFSQNALQAGNISIYSDLWVKPYKFIYQANLIITGLDRTEKVSLNVKTQVLAEAKFIRSFCYFYLVNLFGDVPLTIRPEYENNNSLPRSPVADVYQQIIKDLTEAKANLPGNYSISLNERIRPNKYVAAALLARVYLYMGNWTDAEAESSEVLGETSLYRLVNDLNSVFLKNSTEAIWQLMPVIPGRNTWDGSTNILTSTPSSFSLSNQLIGSFELLTDKRRTNWVGTITNASGSYQYSFKYKVRLTNQPLTEYQMVLRLAEQYLIRAEARIQLNKIAEGVADLNVLRAKARPLATASIPDPLPPLLINSKDEAIQAVERERFVELFSEWGHRWFDLKRTGRANTVLSVIKGTNWQPTDVLYPIPLTELINNPKMTPNPGY